MLLAVSWCSIILKIIAVEAYSSNPYPLRIHIIPNEVTVISRNHEATGWVVSGPPWSLRLKLMQILDGYRLLLTSYTSHGKKISECWEFAQFPTSPLSTDFGIPHGMTLIKLSQTRRPDQNPPSWCHYISKIWHADNQNSWSNSIDAELFSSIVFVRSNNLFQMILF